MISISINDQVYQVPEGITVLQAAEANGIDIPTLCYHKDLSPYGGCRMCVVQVRGARLPMTACNLPVSPALEIRTDTEKIINYRKAVLRMLLVNYYDAGYKRYNGGCDIERDSELMHWCRVYGVDVRARMASRPVFPIDSDPNPFIWVDMNKCIQCGRCVRACAEVQGRFVWSQSYRGYRARIVAGNDSTLLQSRCESCGACVAYCPTGALDLKPSVRSGCADRVTTTTCGYCGVGCKLDLNVRADEPGGRIIRVTSYTGPESSYNGMHLCVKGRFGYEFIHAPERIARPRVRQYLLDKQPRPAGLGPWAEVDWDTALDLAAAGLRQARDRAGEGGVGVLASGKLSNEENYLLAKLARQLLNTDHIDLSAYLYHRAATDGLEETLGIQAASTTFEDITDHAGALLVVGANLTEQHPVLGARVRQAVLRRKLPMVVIHPDFTNIAEFAALALYPHPGTQAVLLNGLMNLLLESGLPDPPLSETDLEGFDAFRRTIAKCPASLAVEICGVAESDLRRAAEILGRSRPVGIIWSVGAADLDHGRDLVRNLANLHLLLGGPGSIGGGVLPLPEHNNSQGAADMGARAGWLPGYRRLEDAAARQDFERGWGAKLPAASGLKANEMLAAVGEGKIAALYILGEEILNTTPQGARYRARLKECPFVVLQEAAFSETDRYADVILPGTTFAEKDGTFTSGERRIQLVREAVAPPGEARPDWQIIAGLARRLMAGSPLEGSHSRWDYAGASEILSEIAALVPIYAGVTPGRLEAGERLHWPAAPEGKESASKLEIGPVKWAVVEPVEAAPAGGRPLE